MRFVDYLELGKRLAALSSKAKPSFRTKIISRYASEDDGSMIIFGLFSFVIIMITAGIAVDVIRHETLRAELQNTLDRAVLAAANPTTELDRKEVVIDYFRAAGLTKYLNQDEITVEENGSASRVSATVTADIKTAFMWMAGVDTLPLRSSAAAAQSIGDIEISMVLDVSKSMEKNPTGNGTRLSSLSKAGQTFAQKVYEGGGGVSVSVVPYSMQVNAGKTILSKFNRSTTHEDSHCLNFSGTDFNSTSMSLIGKGTSKTYQQTLHFDPISYRWRSSAYLPPNYVTTEEGLNYPACDTREANKVLPFASTELEVSKKIKGLAGTHSTSIDIGVKWGAALLDPSMRPAVDALISSGEVSSEMAGRPVDYVAGDAEPTKFLVVMSDGENDREVMMKAAYRDTPSNSVFEWHDPSDPAHTMTLFKGSSRRFLGYDGWGYPVYETVESWYHPATNKSYAYTNFDISDMTALTWQQIWARYTIGTYRYIKSISTNNSYPYTTTESQAQAVTIETFGHTKDMRLQAACSAAKNKGVIIFTVGFDLNYTTDPNNAKAQLRNCATNAGYFYDANGSNLETAFESIAAEISKLRLVE